MQTRRQLTRKSSNIENTPITPRGSLMKPLHGGAYRNGLHRIRRKVSGVKPYAFSAEQALKKRSLKIRPVAVAAMPTPPTTPKVEPADTPSPLSKPFPFNAPRHLQRPEFKDIPRANLVAIEPHLKDAPLPFIRDGLQIIGVGAQNVLAGVRAAAPVPNTQLPHEITITVTNVDGPLPTHMLAIYPRAEKVADKTQVTLFPIHDIFVAAHCAHVPQLPPAAQPTVQVAPGTQITIPVVPFSVPHPESFPILTTYLYAKRPEQLLSRLLPVPHPTPAGPSLEERQLQIATALTQKYTTRGIFDLIMVVNGLWRNTCALGVFDEKLWCAMELSWQILLAALAIAVGKYEDFVASQA